MRQSKNHQEKPEILAPAGNQESFLAAVAAGANAIYCGLQSFSARMGAKNFTIQELGRLVQLAHHHDIRVYVAFNSFLKSNELQQATTFLRQLTQWVRPDDLIVHDLGLMQLARQARYSGEIHFSTLANVSFSRALPFTKNRLGIHRVVLPRESSIDELKIFASNCPEELGLEVFVHGALCYGVSGRCYWSSYLGGKSGLRGRCVQPCRRRYTQQQQTRRFFSCQDLSLDVLVKTLLTIPQIRAWKIEGRKKGPHYVYHTVTAYRMLRDMEDDPDTKTFVKKAALALLAQALGRSGTHYQFLPQRPQTPIKTNLYSGSGMFVGHIQGLRSRAFIRPNVELFSGDVLRVGYEDEPGHTVISIHKHIPRKGHYEVGKYVRTKPVRKTPVFLTDRKAPAMVDKIASLKAELDRIKAPNQKPLSIRLKKPITAIRKWALIDEFVFRKKPVRMKSGRIGCWIRPDGTDLPAKGHAKSMSWWLPPVVWPSDENEMVQSVQRILKAGGRRFVLNSPWQISLFPNITSLELWAGPFCNLGNEMAIETIADLRFTGAIVSPELGKQGILSMPAKCSLPLGLVIYGSWPLCISRIPPPQIKPELPFRSPKAEVGWTTQYGFDFWIYPGWRLDLKRHRKALIQAGYRFFIYLMEPIPDRVRLKKRSGLWNWDIGLQ